MDNDGDSDDDNDDCRWSVTWIGLLTVVAVEISAVNDVIVVGTAVHDGTRLICIHPIGAECSEEDSCC